MEITTEPRVVTRPDLPYVGIRVVTPFRGMLGVRDELLAEAKAQVAQLEQSVVGHGFLRLHVIDMSGPMDIEVGLLTPGRTEHEGRLRSGVLPAGRYATLTYTGVGTAANRALLDWVRSQGLALDRREVPEGDWFACRYEAYLTDPALEPRKKKWDIELAFRLAD